LVDADLGRQRRTSQRSKSVGILAERRRSEVLRTPLRVKLPRSKAFIRRFGS
jgi:hypothetical protein